MREGVTGNPGSIGIRAGRHCLRQERSATISYNWRETLREWKWDKIKSEIFEKKERRSIGMEATPPLEREREAESGFNGYKCNVDKRASNLFGLDFQDISRKSH